MGDFENPGDGWTVGERKMLIADEKMSELIVR